MSPTATLLAVEQHAAAPTAELTRIADICERAAAGDLEARIVGVPEDRELARLCHAINRMLDIADS